EPLPQVWIDRSRGECLDLLGQLLAKALMGHRATGRADNRELARQEIVLCQVVQGGNELALGQIARRAENHHYTGVTLATYALTALAYPALLSEGTHCRRLPGIHLIGTDHFLDVHHVTVMRVLGARTRPQDALLPCPVDRQCLPTRPLEDPPSIGDVVERRLW